MVKQDQQSAEERRRAQNRTAQRNYRQNVKNRIASLQLVNQHLLGFSEGHPALFRRECSLQDEHGSEPTVAGQTLYQQLAMQNDNVMQSVCQSDRSAQSPYEYADSTRHTGSHPSRHNSYSSNMPSRYQAQSPSHSNDFPYHPSTYHQPESFENAEYNAELSVKETISRSRTGSEVAVPANALYDDAFHREQQQHDPGDSNSRLHHSDDENVSSNASSYFSSHAKQRNSSSASSNCSISTPCSTTPLPLHVVPSSPSPSGQGTPGSDYLMLPDASRTPLHQAVANGHMSVARVLLSNGADVNALDANGWTPLHTCAVTGHAAFTRMLIANGALPELRNNHGMAPLQLAAALGAESVVEVLLEQGALINSKFSM